MVEVAESRERERRRKAVAGFGVGANSFLVNKRQDGEQQGSIEEPQPSCGFDGSIPLLLGANEDAEISLGVGGKETHELRTAPVVLSSVNNNNEKSGSKRKRWNDDAKEEKKQTKEKNQGGGVRRVGGGGGEGRREDGRAGSFSLSRMRSDRCTKRLSGDERHYPHPPERGQEGRTVGHLGLKSRSPSECLEAREADRRVASAPPHLLLVETPPR
ncbi:hypothetical protein V1477_006944, partial [Vespula maculifrons]